MILFFMLFLLSFWFVIWLQFRIGSGQGGNSFNSALTGKWKVEGDI